MRRQRRKILFTAAVDGIAFCSFSSICSILDIFLNLGPFPRDEGRQLQISWRTRTSFTGDSDSTMKKGGHTNFVGRLQGEARLISGIKYGGSKGR